MGIMHFMSRFQKVQVDSDKYVFMISPISEPYRVQDFMSHWYTPVERDKFVEWLDNDAYDLAAKCIKKKTYFAMDIIFHTNETFNNWEIPSYIKEGLLWLKKD